MRPTLLLAWLSLVVIPGGLRAQAELYDPNTVREIRLYFATADWDHVLDSLYLLDEDERLLGDLVIDGTTIPDVGVRYKGFSSYSSSRDKNPFNIKLNEVHQGQNYQGYDKLKLSNVIQDPSFIREVLSYEIARKYMPAPLANFANVYVNDVLIGLYTNVEAVNKEFTEKHFDSRSNAFFKGNPETVDLNGENSNLSDSPGTDPADYYTLYQLESDAGWEELLELIDTLNNHPEQIEKLLNVDRTLWMHAFNYSLINFDSYVGYAQNYYLFKDNNDRWNPIPWDLNMSFASFRLADASLYWNGFSIPQAITMDPLMHHNSPSVYPRPLMRNLFATATYRRMYIAHLRTIIQENFLNQEYATRAVTLRNSIDGDVQADTNKFYSYQAFLDNLDQTVSDLIDYPGIKELMDQRSVYLSSYPGFSGEPSIDNLAYSPQAIAVGGQVTLLADIANADSAFLAYRYHSGGLFLSVEMKDDGMHNDGAAGDGTYGATVSAETNLLQYYLYAENDSAGVFSPVRAAFEYHEISTLVGAGELVINEIMAYNEGSALDEQGEADDWIELYNRSNYTYSTAGMFLSDDADDLQKWALPVVVLQPNDYLLIWADGQPGQGDHHANFQLNASGESLYLAYSDSLVLDGLTFGMQYPISSTGRSPNGIGSFRELYPTFNARNVSTDNHLLDAFVQIYPNPSNGDVFVIVREEGQFDIQLYSMDGREITGRIQRDTNELIRINTAHLSQGMYVIQIRTETNRTQRTFVLTQ